MNILVTGGAGFVGSNLVQYLLNKYPQYRIVNLDKLTYAGNLANLESAFENPNHSFVKGDICDRDLVQGVLRDHSVEAVIHCAAESHVDRSIVGSTEFIVTNILGTQVLLECARESGVSKFVQVSTDEVYGSLGGGQRSTEDTPLQPSNPYAASKAAGDLLALAFCRTYGLPVVVTRCTKDLPLTDQPVVLCVVGSAMINEQNVTREAVPAEDRMQAFLWRHLVPASEFKVSVYDPTYTPPPRRVPKPRPPAEPNATLFAASAGQTNSQPKFSKQQVAGRLRQLKLLFEEGLLTEDFNAEKVAECEAAR